MTKRLLPSKGCSLLVVSILLFTSYCAGIAGQVVEPPWFREVVIYEVHGELFIEYRTEFDSQVSEIKIRNPNGVIADPNSFSVIFVEDPVPLTWSELQRHLNLTSNSVELESSMGPVNISRTWIGYRVSGIFYDPRAPAAFFATHVVDRR